MANPEHQVEWAALAESFDSIVQARKAGDWDKARLHARATVEPLRRQLTAQPAIAARALAVVADTLSAGANGQFDSSNAEVLTLYLESFTTRAATAVDEEVSITALKAAHCAFVLDDAGALELALGCAAQGPGYAASIARNARSVRLAQRGEYAQALEALGPALDYDAPRLRGALLFALARYAEAAEAWLSPHVAGYDRAELELAAAWSFHRLGNEKRAKKLLAGLRSRGRRAWYVSEEVEATLVLLEQSFEPPPELDAVWGPAPRPEKESFDLRVYKTPSLANLLESAAELRQLAEGTSETWIERARRYANELRSSGEEHQRAAYDPLLRRILSAVEQRHGAASVEATEIVLLLFYGSLRMPAPDRLALARRFLEVLERRPPTTEEISSVAYVAERLVDELSRSTPLEAGKLAERWSAYCDEHQRPASKLHHLAAMLAREQGDNSKALTQLERALATFGPDDYDTLSRSFAYRCDLAEVARAAGAPRLELERALAEERTQLAQQWRAGLRKTAKAHAVVDLLAPSLSPGEMGAIRFSAPFDLLAEVGQKLGRSFLSSRVNARPAHSVLLEACRPHRAQTTFFGSAWSLEIDTLTTADTPETRAALASADELTGLHDGLLYAWWD